MDIWSVLHNAVVIISCLLAVNSIRLSFRGDYDEAAFYMAFAAWMLV